MHMILLLTALITSPLPSASLGKKATGPPDIQPALSPDYLLHTTNGKILLGLVVLAVLTIIFLVILGRGHGETEELGNDEDDEDEAIQPEMTHSMEEFSTPTEIYTPHPSSLYTPPEIKAEGPERSQSYSSSSKFQIQGLPDFSPDPSYQEEPPEQKSDIPVEPFVSPPPISSFPPENRQGPSDSNLKPNPEEVVSFPSWTPKPVENSEVTDSSGIPKIFDEPAVERENGAERTVSPEETEMPVVNLDEKGLSPSKFTTGISVSSGLTVRSAPFSRSTAGSSNILGMPEESVTSEFSTGLGVQLGKETTSSGFGLRLESEGPCLFSGGKDEIGGGETNGSTGMSLFCSGGSS